MSKTIAIQNTQLPVIEYQGQRVITTELLAQGYGTDSARIRQNFNRNKERFTQGKHYFTLEGKGLQQLKNCVSFSDAVNKHTTSLTLWSERGASRHAKMLETDQAWEWYEALEDNYFRLREQKSPVDLGLPNFLDPAEAAIAWGKERKAVQLITFERDEAVRTKAQISEKREATACQRNAVYQRIANRAIKERDEMAALLGASKHYASVRSVWRATGNWYSYRQLTTWQDEHDAMESYYWDESTDARILCY
ncbi:ORF6N domain-containing protein, partial [Candidatus Symbiopectobacterium sp.]|uniref:ORF6N domain-containing protein n=1 Tax=Candidatus Symbiopectobacterium sp. TaxID=2816440 RepID=UPI0025C6DC23